MAEKAEDIAKIQRDVEELKDAMRDNYHDRRESYEKRVKEALGRSANCVTLWFEIDGIKSSKDIRDSLESSGRGIPQQSFSRALTILCDAGLLRKVGVRKEQNNSPIYAKKAWAADLNMDDYVRKIFHV